MDFSESFVREFFGPANIPSLIVEKEGFVVRSVNPAFLSGFDLSGDLTGKSLSQIFPSTESGSDLFRYLDEFATNANASSHNVRIQFPGKESGSPKYFKINIIPFTGPDGIELWTILFNDISSEVISRLNLEEQEYSFRKMITEAPIAIAILRGHDLVIESANDSILEMWGKDNVRLGMPLLELMPELVSQPFPEILRNVMKSGEDFYGFEFSANLQRNNKLQNCYFNFIYTPVKENNGEHTRVMVIAYEVTAQVMAKKELQQSEKRFRNLVEESLVATGIYVGEEMRIDLANDAMIRLWGKDRSVVGKTVREALPELEGQPFHGLLANVYKTGVTYRGTEDRADLVVDGKLQTFYFNFTYKALRNAAGEIYGILNMAVDITEQYLAKKRIQESEQRLSLAINSANLGTFELQVDNNRMLYTPRLAEIFGLDPSQPWDHQEFKNRLHPEDLRIRDEAHRRALETGSLFYEARVVHKDNSIHWIRLNGGLSKNENGKVARMYGTVMDITASKTEEDNLRRSEERLRQLAQELELRVQERTRDLKDANAELVRSNQELEQFAFITSHDLQEPLRKVRTFTNLLAEKSSASLDEKGKIYLNKINASSARMSELISSLLNFSRLMRDEDRIAPVDLNEVLINVMSDFELLIRQKSALIEYEDLPVIRANPLQMNQLLYNLIINALKFTKPGDSAHVRIFWKSMPGENAALLFGLSREKDYYHITVEDNGIGFEQQYAEKIFEIFQRLNDRTAYEGTGIGLALCKKIVNNHSGFIYAESELNRGATFHVILPK